MAVLVALSDTTLGTALGFNKVMAKNLGSFSTTELAITTTRTIAFTPAFTGSMLGVFLDLSGTAATSGTKGARVELLESGTIRAVRMLSASEIVNNDSSCSGCWTKYVDGGTFPYFINSTAAGIWSIRVIDSGSLTNAWSLRTSDATNPFYIVVADSRATYVDNQDIPVSSYQGKIGLDQDFTFKGDGVTGNATESVCGVIGSYSDPTAGGVNGFYWAATAPIQGRLNGYFAVGAHAAFRVGTSSNTLSMSSQGTLQVLRATSGTATISGFVGPFGSATTNRESKNSILIYGAVPTDGAEDAVLSADVALGASSFTTTLITGWSSGDLIFVGGQSTRGLSTFVNSTVLNSTGLTVNLSSGIVGSIRATSGRVIRYNGYGFRLFGDSGAGVAVQDMGTMANFTIYGTEIKRLGFRTNGNGGTSIEASDRRSSYIFSHCSVEGNTGGSVSSFANVPPHQEPLLFDHFNVVKNGIYNATLGGSNNPNAKFTDCINIYCGPVNGTPTTFSASSVSPQFLRCSFENSNNNFITMNGILGVVAECRFYGNSAVAMRYNTGLNFTNSGNMYDNNATAFQLAAVISGIETDSKFGTLQSNTTDINAVAGSYYDWEFASPSGNLTLSATSTSNLASLPGSMLRFSDYNDTPNDDRTELPYGKYQRCGAGLSDTTVRTAGTFSIRLAPNEANFILNYPNLDTQRAVPTGDIQNQTMTVSCWVYINNSNYAAGTYTLPTLYVKYDNLTTVTDVASSTFGSWQQLSVTFTPTTQLGQIKVWVGGATDALSTDAYFYIADFNVAYPAGDSLNLGSQTLWVNALPVWPPIATTGLTDSLWDSQTSAHTQIGSFGKLAITTEIKADDASVLRGVV